jgi:formylglycine-generating enzyme required for sulfatase activity
LIGQYAVTQAQWRAVAGLPKRQIDLNSDPSRFKGDNLPVEQVSWLEAVEFCDRLSQFTGRTYRLPSEAEWEYACRAATTTPFYFGETITTDLVNYNGNYTYNRGPKGIYREKTTAVGSFPPNAFGLYDMHGNVYEWCADPWPGNYNSAPTDGSVWESGRYTQCRVVRGGSWITGPSGCRSADRYVSEPDSRGTIYGFRVVSFPPAWTP